MILWKSLAKPW